MLANSFECVGNINKLEIRQSSQTRKTYVYNDIRLRDIVEPAGMHIFSLYKDALSVLYFRPNFSRVPT